MTPDAIATLISGGLFIFLLVVWVIFCVMLVIAPLMVWKWAKRTCAAVEGLQSAVSALEKKVSSVQAQSLAELRLIRESAKQGSGGVRPPRPPAVPPTIPAAPAAPRPPPADEALAVCPECGAVFGFDAKLAEVDVTCPYCKKPFHIH